MKKVYAFIANGSEEVECLAVVDILKRGGVDVTLVSVEGKGVITSHGARIVADCVIEDVNLRDADLLFLPGGMPGTNNLGDCKKLMDGVCLAVKEGRRVGAICAAPYLLGKLGLLNGKTATCYPGFESELVGANVTKQGVVTDGLITTARGLGFGIDLGLELLTLLVGADVAQKVKSAIQYN